MPEARCFLAIDLGKEIERPLKQLTKRLESSCPQIAWVKSNQVHLTLHFFGQLSFEAIDELRPGLTVLFRRVNPIKCVFQGMGAFPSFKQPKVLWLGLGQGQAELIAIKQKLDRFLSEKGHTVEQRPFRPHLTLGRFGAHHPRAVHLDANLLQYRIAEPFVAQQTILFKSELKPSGSIYSPMAQFALSAKQG